MVVTEERVVRISLWQPGMLVKKFDQVEKLGIARPIFAVDRPAIRGNDFVGFEPSYELSTVTPDAAAAVRTVLRENGSKEMFVYFGIDDGQ
jgi:hypothetical protein